MLRSIQSNIWGALLLAAALSVSCSNNPFDASSGNKTDATDNNTDGTISISESKKPGTVVWSHGTDLFRIVVRELPDEADGVAAKISASKSNKIYSAKISPKKTTISSGEKVTLEVIWDVKIYNSTRGTINIYDRLTGQTWSESFSKLKGSSSGKKYEVSVTFWKKFIEFGEHIIDTGISLDTGESDADKNEARIIVKGTPDYHILGKASAYGKDYYFSIEQHGSFYEFWARENENACGSNDKKITTMEYLKMQSDQAMNLLCAGKKIFDTGEVVVGCTATVGSVICIPASGTGVAIPVCYTVVNYAGDKGFTDCLSGFSEEIGLYFDSVDIVEGRTKTVLALRTIDGLCKYWEEWRQRQ